MLALARKNKKKIQNGMTLAGRKSDWCVCVCQFSTRRIKGQGHRTSKMFTVNYG